MYRYVRSRPRFRISSITLFLLLVGVAIGLVAPAGAWAHGGQFRGPGDQIPPGLRQPYDPTTPPPPPTPTPVTPTPVTPTPFQPRPNQPVTPSAQPPTVTAPTGGGPTRGSKGATTFDDWTFWYHHNNAGIENLKWALYHRLTSPNPIFQMGGDAGGQGLGAATRLTQRAVTAIVIPTLLWAMDPKNAGYNDTESAAYIALAKVTRDPAHIEALMAGLDLQRAPDAIVQESAALALGLLRRAAPDDQFLPRELDRVRAFLFDVFENERYADRVRGFAALSIGLLGDQPTGAYGADGQAAARTTTERLFSLLAERYSNEDLLVALMMAIGLQPASSVLPEQRELLVECALKGRCGRDDAGVLTRSYAALALGRIGSANEIGALENILLARHNMRPLVQASAATGLGLLGGLVSGPDRVRVADVLVRTWQRSGDLTTRNFTLIALAYLLREDVRTRRTDVLRETQADEILIAEAKDGHYNHRGFAALGLGLVLREAGDDLAEAWQPFYLDALGVLRERVAARGLDAKSRGAFCTALGIARDLESRKALLAILEDESNEKMVRGYAALGLGLIGLSSPEVVTAIAKALDERSSEELRRQTAVALGLLGKPRIPGTNGDAVDLLLEELRRARSQSHKGQVVLALARVGDHRVVEALAAIVRDEGEQKLTRALACAGLGIVGDLELMPSLARASQDVNYRASTNLIDEFLSIL